MGLMGVQENGNGEMGLSGVSLGSKYKYKMMDSDMKEDEDDGASLHHHHLQEEDRKSNIRKYVFACAVFASLNSVLLGYDVGVMSGAIIFIQEDLKMTEVQEEILVGILSIISLLGSLAGGKTSDVIGRKWTMALAAIVFQTGAVIMTLAPSFKVLMIGRLFAGVGIGFGVMIAPVYIVEISPTIARGALTSFPEIFINIGILLGYVSNYAFSGLPAHINWRIMLAVGILPSVFIGFALCIIPESPRWLVVQNRVDEARAVLLKTNENESEVEERLAEIQEAAGNGNPEKYEEKAVWRELLSPSPALGRMLITGFGIQCFQQITGQKVVVFLHGFPEIWYTWRHQMIAAADKGYRAIAFDFRGYGLSDQPPEPEKSNFLDLVDDVVGVLDSLGINKAILVGKDFGAIPAYLVPALHPERVSCVVTLGVPFMLPGPSATQSHHLLPKGFYITRWQEPGRAEADFGRFDVKTVIRNIYTLFSSSEVPVAGDDQEIMDLFNPSTPLPAWFSEEDLTVYASLYEKSGFCYALHTEL